jgi:hypothetical protein
MILSEAKAALANTKLNTSLTDIAAGTNQLWVLQDLLDAINFGTMKAWDYKPWTFTQGHVAVTLPNPLTASYAYPVNFEDESVEFVSVNGVPWIGPANGKRTFRDYQKWLSDYPTDTSLIWSEFARQYFLNKNACAIGQTVDLYGKLRYTKLASDGDLLPFSPTSDALEDSGNQAIIKLAYSYLLGSEKKKDIASANAMAKEAYADLDIVWKPMGERRAQMQAQNKPFFNGQDLFPTRRSTRYDTQIGNFP